MHLQWRFVPYVFLVIYSQIYDVRNSMFQMHHKLELALAMLKSKKTILELIFVKSLLYARYCAVEKFHLHQNFLEDISTGCL